MKRMNQGAAVSQTVDLSTREFLKNMHNVIRNRMDAIIEMTRLTLETDITKKQREYLETVSQSADSLVAFMNEILDFSHIKANQLELEEIDFDMRNTLEHAVEALKMKAKAAGLDLSWHIDPDVPVALRGDPGRLCQIINNLTQIAIKLNKNGKLTIRLKTKKKEKATVLLHFVVSGIGTGISREQMAKVYESFAHVDNFTITDPDSEILGLTISKHLVGMMNGRMWLESEIGDGGTFHFTALFGLSHKKVGDTLYLKDLDLSGVPVLIVDDNEINRLVFKKMICSRGLVSVEAANGKEAIVKTRDAFNEKKPYRLMLLDLQMPGMNGFEVAKEVKSSPFGEDVKIILLTSVGQKGDTSHCKALGISGYLLKPVKQSELLDAISIVLGHSDDKKPPVITRYTIQEARKRLNNSLALANEK